MAAFEGNDAETVAEGSDEARIIGDVAESEAEDGEVAIRGLSL